MPSHFYTGLFPEFSLTPRDGPLLNIKAIVGPWPLNENMNINLFLSYTKTEFRRMMFDRQYLTCNVTVQI
jgi:hypothetical protein